VDDSLVNKQGYKDNDFVIEKAPSLIRIAMLGDSITQGVHAPLGKTFSDQLEILLNQKAAQARSPLHYEVMNFGVAGYNLEAEVELLKTKVLAYSPDIVVFNLFHNDADPIPSVMMFMNDNQDRKMRFLLLKKYFFHKSDASIVIRRLLYKSKLYLFLVTHLGNISGLPVDTKTFAAKHIDWWDGPSVERNFAEIERLRQLHGFKVLLCMHCHLLYAEHPNNQKFAEMAQRFHFPFFHSVVYYKAAHADPASVRLAEFSGDTCHPNELGHTILAHAMLEEMKKYRLLDIAQ
jgi:lysophospholipase L1-like esterase